MSTKLRVFFNFFIRFAILALSVFFLYVQFEKKIQTGGLSFSFGQLSATNIIIKLAIVFLLMFVNWASEIYKWRYLTSAFTNVSLGRCIKGVVSGITISMFLPNRIGDVAGKVLWLDSGSRWKGAFSNIYASMAQVLATIIVATAAVWYFANIIPKDNEFVKTIVLLQWITFAAASAGLLVYYRLRHFSKVLSKLKFRKIQDIAAHSAVLDVFSNRKLTIILGLSIFRFLIYSFQFYLLLQVFGVNVGFVEGMLVISVMYLFISFVPQFAIAEIATRGAIAVFVFQFLCISCSLFAHSYESALLFASSLLWLINLFVPAMAGLTMLPDVKRLKQKTRQK